MEERIFSLIGDRLIDCTMHCPVRELGEKTPETRFIVSDDDLGIVTYPPGRSVPVCDVSGAPKQTGREDPRLVVAKRGCVFWARQFGRRLMEQQ